ncbi:hypothetical protein ACWF0M_04455 [Kribbella sp. NPDC055110]
MLPVIGYINAQLVSDADLDELLPGLAAWARGRESVLVGVHVEHADSAPDAFRALIEQAGRQRIRIVVLPSLLHLSSLGPPVVLKRHLEHLLAGEVWLAGYPTIDRADVPIPASASALSTSHVASVCG